MIQDIFPHTFDNQYKPDQKPGKESPILYFQGDKLLLTRYANRPFSYCALIAGFTEVGETLEETVKREVFEETGIHVKNIRYYKSQPWAITGDILAGFFCEADGSTDITIDPSELSEAFWAEKKTSGSNPTTTPSQMK